MLHCLLARQVAFILPGLTALYPVAHLNAHVSPKTFVSLNKHLGGVTVNLGSIEIAPHFTPTKRNVQQHCTIIQWEQFQYCVDGKRCSENWFGLQLFNI
jgi:hypothetical protein